MANSKLLLIHDVEDLGRSGDIVTVKPGYARNFLIPQKFAMVADARAIKMQTKLQEERKKRAIVDKQEAEKTASLINDVQVTTAVKVDHDGHMYGSVTQADIVELVKAQTGIELEKRNIQLKHALKEIGEFNVAIKLKEGVASHVKVVIVAEEQK